MKNLFNYIGLAALSILIASTSCNNAAPETAEETTTMEQAPAPEPAPIPVADTHVNTKVDTVWIRTTMGDITVILYNETPKHHDNFIKLVKENYYDGVLFHRVIPGFMIQGGDPESKKAVPGAMYGSGGPNYLIPAEIMPNLRHKKGALAAARTENPEKASSGSQFYICHIATPQLDGQYTVFGETIAGFDVIDKIANVQRDPYDRPLKDIKIIGTSLDGFKKADKKEKAGKKSSKDK